MRSGEAHLDATFAGARRIDLTEGAWLELVPNWLLGHQALFDLLVAQTRFRSEQRLMYGRMVEVPQHAIPKSRTVGAQPRIAIMFRPHWEPLQPDIQEP